MNLQQSVSRSNMPIAATITVADLPALEAADHDNQANAAMEQRAEWSLGISQQNWRLLAPEARMPDFVLRLAFMKSLPDAPIDIRVMLFAHTCRITTAFTGVDFQCAWRMLVDAYEQEPPEVRQMLKGDMNFVHAKCATHGDGGVPWDRSLES